MYIAVNEMSVPNSSIISIIPTALKKYFFNINLCEAQEIGFIQGQPIHIRFPDGNMYISQKGVLTVNPRNAVRATRKHMEEMLEKATGSSIYSFKEQIKDGYITIDGGHRIGITGTVIMGEGGVEFIKSISAMNIRIANQVPDAAKNVMEYIFDGDIKSTLVVSPPGCGKTTILRDIARNISHKGYSVGIADERSELASMNMGESIFDLGEHTVVLENCPKAVAMTMLLRTMSPDVIITDELGNRNDQEAVYDVINSGVRVIASAHGRDTYQLQRREVFKKLLPLFEVIIVMSKKNGVGTIEEVIRS